MRHVVECIVLIAVIGFVFAGCGKKSESQPAAPSAGGGPGGGFDIQKQADALKTSANQSLAAARDTFVETAQKTLDDLSAKVKDLKAKPAPGGLAQADWDKLLSTVDTKLSEAMTQLKNVKESSADAWQKAQPALNTALDDLKKAYDEATAKLKGA
jgi:hypothetical protein